MRALLRRVKPTWTQARPILIVGILLTFIFLFFFWRLASMTPGLGPGEYASRQNSQDAGQIITKGLNAPYYLMQYAFIELLNDDVWALRLTSVFFGLVIFTSLFLLMRGWFGHIVALFASLIFVTTPWVIIMARTGTPNIMLLWLIVPLACFILMGRSKQRTGVWWLLLCFTACLSLYTPALIWFMLAGILIAWKPFLNASRRINALYLILGMFIAILLVAPLVLSLVLEPILIRKLLLIPIDWQSGGEMLKSIAWSAASLFWNTRNSVDIGIDRLPILNILQIVLVVFGLYALASRARNITYILIGLLIFAVLAAGINDDPHFLMLGLPTVAVLIGAGLRYLYIEWRRVFPINPFAYALAIGLISIVVSTHLLYAARYSLIAWPQTSETKSTYVLK